MAKFSSPLKEIDYRIGRFYETVIQSNLKMTESTENLQITVRNLIAADTRVKDLVLAHQIVKERYANVANI